MSRLRATRFLFFSLLSLAAATAPAASREEDLAAVSKGQATAPIGKQRLASEIDWPPGSAARNATAPAPNAAYVPQR